MQIAEVLVRVEQIRSFAEEQDDQRAHDAEDALYRDVLTEIAHGSAEMARELAREALETTRIDFSRWTA